jgi:signal transduction histidine kinase
VLAYRTAQQRRRLEHYAEDLETQVQRRTKELQESNQELSVANQEIHRQIEMLGEQAREIELSNARLQELNAELYDANIQLQNLNATKDEFLGIAAHDLKNPLSTIISASDLLATNENEMPREERQTFLAMITCAAVRMLKLVQNLLEVNRIERGAATMAFVRLNVAAMVQSAVADYSFAQEEKHIRFEIDADDTIRAIADEQGMQQVLDNLLSNAIKFSPASSTVIVRVKNDREGEYVRTEIQDAGPGLSATDKEQLFGSFARLSAQPTGGEHSTGLGLSIVKKLVEAMNGRVWCESELGKGAKFVVELPAA